MKKAGSYQMDEIKDAELELKRLGTQAQLMKPLEMKILKETGLLTDHKVLEIGCGPGFITSILCEIANQGQVYATDTDDKLLELCRKTVTNPPKNGFITVNNTLPESLNFLNSQIDYSYLRFVLQHVPDTEKLLNTISSTLKPGGIICVLDSDDGLVIQYPEDSFINSILSDAKKLQSEKGGDRFIGRKIPHLLSNLGFYNIQSQVLNFTHKDIPFNILAKILFGFKSELIGKRQEMEKWVSDTEMKINSGKYFLSGGVILTMAQKSKELM